MTTNKTLLVGNVFFLLNILLQEVKIFIMLSDNRIYKYISIFPYIYSVYIHITCLYVNFLFILLICT